MAKRGQRGKLSIVESSEEFEGSKCMTYVKDDGSYYSSGGKRARRSLTEASGAPKPGDVCRHKCENDSNLAKRPGGFVCCNPSHLHWGTHSENMQDIKPEVRKASTDVARKAAHLTNGSSKGGKIGGKSPTTATQTKSKCRHCPKVGSTAIMHRWHGARCKHKEISALIDDDSDGQLDLIYNS